MLLRTILGKPAGCQQEEHRSRISLNDIFHDDGVRNCSHQRIRTPQPGLWQEETRLRYRRNLDKTTSSNEQRCVLSIELEYEERSESQKYELTVSFEAKLDETRRVKI
jgi:hypothetical protein